MIKKLSLFYGEIYWVDFDPSLGHEFQGRRPAVVVQSDAQLKKSNLATVMPFTSNTKNMMEDDILVEPSSNKEVPACTFWLWWYLNANYVQILSIFMFSTSSFLRQLKAVSGFKPCINTL